MSHIFVFLSINTTHAAIFFYATPLNRCSSTTIFIYRNMYVQQICFVRGHVLAAHTSTNTGRGVGEQFMDRMLQWKSEREKGRRKKRRKRTMKWIRTKRSHFAFSAGKISVHKRIRFWANILNEKKLFYWKLKWITWLVNYWNKLEIRKLWQEKSNFASNASIAVRKIVFILCRSERMNCGCTIRSNKRR